MKKNSEERSSIVLVSDGLKIFGVLHMPQDAKNKKVPCVLFCHGFGGNKSGKFRLAVKQAERLAEAGIASLRIDFRGSGDSEGDFSETTIKTELEDAKVGLDYILNHPQIDPSRIGVLGRSLGGAVATRLAAASGQVKAVVLWCPLFDAKPWIESHKNSPIHFMGQRLSEECIQEFVNLDLVEPLERLAKTPMLIVRACMDEILDAYHHEGYLAQRVNSTHTEAIELAKSSHDFADVADQKELLDVTTSFLREKL